MRSSYCSSMKKQYLLYLLVLLGCCELSHQEEEEVEVDDLRYAASSLQQVHVIFRHGERTPDSYCTYLDGSNDNETYWPIGFGGLTQLGKMQEYQIGVALRQKYSAFLGDIYTPDIMYARSTDYARTKMSMQLALAGLWPPSYEQNWNWELNWQPVPFDYAPKGNDQMLGYPKNCKNYLTEYNKVINSNEVQSMLKSKQRLLDYIAKNSGSGVSLAPVENAYGLYACLYTMIGMGKPLPSWAELIYPSALEKLSVLEYTLKTYNNLMMQYTGGQWIKQVLDDSRNKIMGRLSPAGRKLFLYSAHEYNVAHTLRALNSFVPHYPSYASYVVIELHRFRQIYGFKIFYQNYKQTEPVPIRIPGCGLLCPVEDFASILANNIPSDELIC